jgi:hypothetical protein
VGRRETNDFNSRSLLLVGVLLVKKGMLLRAIRIQSAPGYIFELGKFLSQTVECWFFLLLQKFVEIGGYAIVHVSACPRLWRVRLFFIVPKYTVLTVPSAERHWPILMLVLPTAYLTHCPYMYVFSRSKFLVCELEPTAGP